MLVHWEFGAESSASCPTHVLWIKFSVPPSPLLFVLDYTSLFMFFSFAGVEWGFSLPRGCDILFFLDMGKGVMSGAWCSPVCSAVSCKQLWSQLVGRNGDAFFRVVWGRKTFHGLVVLTEFDSDQILIWHKLCCRTYLLFVGRKRERERERNGWGTSFPQSQTCLAGCAAWDFHHCYVKIKTDLRVSLWISSSPNVMAVIILVRSNQNYLIVSLTSYGGFWYHRA
jgi:hypothetical protein